MPPSARCYIQRNWRQLGCCGLIALGVPPSQAECRNSQRSGTSRHDRKFAFALTVQPCSIVAVLRAFLVRINIRTVNLGQFQLRQLFEAEPCALSFKVNVSGSPTCAEVVASIPSAVKLND